jgi:hypothetical protein
MSQAESLIAPPLSRVALRRDATSAVRPVSFKPAPRQSPGGTGFSLRGKLLYPAILTVLALAAHLVGGKKDELR